MARKIGAITIGQSPRMDVVPEISELLGSNIEILQGGALDGLEYDEIIQLTPVEGDYVLVTKLRDGRSVTIAEKHILGRMQNQIDRLVEDGAETILFLCTGEFPGFVCPKLMLFPQVILQHFVASVATDSKIGVITPDSMQILQATTRWSANGRAAVVEAGSPYGPLEHIWQAAINLKEQGAQIIVMDCIGFNKAMKAEVARLTGLPVVLPRTVVARAVAELMG